ncbi:hypothetical protein ACWDG9_17365 [Streptomyces sp. NPDC001073]
MAGVRLRYGPELDASRVTSVTTVLDCNLQRPQDLLTERQEEFTALCSAWRRTRTLP